MSETIIVEPAIESLFAGTKESLWPEYVLQNRDIKYERRIRRTLLERLEKLFGAVTDPTMDVDAALDAGLVEPDELAKLYYSLANFFDHNPQHRRLVLYLPFEILPPRTWTWDKSHPVQAASNRFRHSYMCAWYALLGDADVRANFFDGNILEEELAPNGQPRVVKAAHLIPKLMEKNLISEYSAKELQNTMGILRDSIDDAFTHRIPVHKEEKRYDRASITCLPDEIAYELRNLDMRQALDTERGLPPARVAWERKNSQDVLISQFAARIANTIVTNTKSDNIAALLRDDASLVARLAAIRGVRDAIVEFSRKDVTSALNLYKALVPPIFDTDWMQQPEIGDEFESLLSYAASVGVLPDLATARLDAEFDKEGLHAKEIKKYESVIEAIADTPEYVALLCPAVIFFGSRLKGYAKSNADLDAAVFVRRGVSPKKRVKIRGILAKLFSDKKIDGKVVEYWLEKDGDALRIRDFPNPDVYLADSSWAHLLFESVWLGKKDTISGLHEALLAPFLNLRGKKFEGRDLRNLCLGEIERDILQYRLMHKGYRRFFPPQGGIKKELKGLDPESVFWDSGYRRLATKLYLKRVFLPQLNVKEKSNK